MKRTIRFSAETDRDLLRLDKVMHDGNVTATISELIRTECRRRFGHDYDVNATSDMAATPKVAHIEIATPKVASTKKGKKEAAPAVAPQEVPNATPEMAQAVPVETPKEVVEDPVADLQAAFDAAGEVVGKDVAPDPSKPVPSWKEKLEADRVRLAEEAKRPKPKEFTGITKQA